MIATTESPTTGRGLRRLLKDDELLTSIEEDWVTAGLSQKRHAMLTYAVKLTDAPERMRREDVTALRDVGFSDRDVLDIAEVVAY